MQKIEHEGVHHVVHVMSQRQLVTAHGDGGIVQSAAPHFGAQGAGIAFPTDLKNNFRNVGGHDAVRDLGALAEIDHGGEIHPLQLHVHGHGAQREVLGVKAL